MALWLYVGKHLALEMLNVLWICVVFICFFLLLFALCSVCSSVFGFLFIIVFWMMHLTKCVFIVLFSGGDRSDRLLLVVFSYLLTILCLMFIAVVFYCWFGVVVFCSWWMLMVCLFFICCLVLDVPYHAGFEIVFPDFAGLMFFQMAKGTVSYSCFWILFGEKHPKFPFQLS